MLENNLVEVKGRLFTRSDRDTWVSNYGFDRIEITEEKLLEMIEKEKTNEEIYTN